MTTAIVYKAIGAVSAAMTKDGISKARKNTQQGYNFRGIDDVMNALSGALVDAGLVILPRCVERVLVEREAKSGGALYNVTCKVEFDLVCTEDGSRHTVSTYGEAMDSADKATNKAMSAAYKYLALLVFCIPTEATPDTDADFTTHEPAKVKPTPAVPARTGVAQDVLSTSPPLPRDVMAALDKLAVTVTDDFEAYGPQAAFERIEAEKLEALEKIYLSTKLDSTTRNKIKAYSIEFHSKKPKDAAWRAGA